MATFSAIYMGSIMIIKRRENARFIFFYKIIRRASMSQYFDNLIWDTFL